MDKEGRKYGTEGSESKGRQLLNFFVRTTNDVTTPHYFFRPYLFHPGVASVLLVAGNVNLRKNGEVDNLYNEGGNAECGGGRRGLMGRGTMATGQTSYKPLHS